MKKTKKLISVFLSMLIVGSIFIAPLTVHAEKKLSSPKKVKVKATSSTSAKITWKKSAKAKSYKILRATSKKGSYKVVGTVSASKKKFTVKKLTTGKVYFFKIKAVSGKRKATSKPVKFKATPVCVNKVSVSAVNDSSAKVTWASQKKVSGYQVAYSTNSNFSKAALVVSKSTSVTITNLALQNYYIRVRSYKTYKKKPVYGPFSKKVVYQNSLTPGKVTGASAVRTTDLSATVKWSAQAKATGYQVTYSVNNNFSGSKSIFVKDGKTTSTTLNLSEKKTYYIKVRAYRIINGKTIYGAYSAVLICSFNALPKDITEEKVSFDKDDSTTYTRGQWVSALVKKLNIPPVDKTDFIGYSFSDISDSEYRDDIEAAFQYHILPITADKDFEAGEDVPTFRPNDPATREFAAYTAVVSQGFEDQTVNTDFADSSSVYYKTQVALAVVNGFMDLQNNMFNPQLPMTGTDKNQIFAKIDQLDKSLNFDTTKKVENIEYKSEVIKVQTKNYQVTKNADGSSIVTIPETAENFKAGNIILLPANTDHPDGYPLKITSVSKTASGYTLTGTSPKPEEIMTTLQFQGEGTPDLENFKVAEGVKVKTSRASGKKHTGTEFDKTISGPGDITFTVNKDIGSNAKLEGKVKMSFPEIKARVNASFGLFSGAKINDLILSIKRKTTLEGKIEVTGIDEPYEITRKSFTSDKKELGRVPVNICTGLSIDLVFNFTVSVKGDITVTYEFVNVDGIQYTNGTLRNIKESSSELKSITAKASAKLGLEIDLGLWAFEVFNLIGLKFEVGLQGDLSFTPHFEVSPAVYCGDAKIFLYMSLGTDSECLFCQITKLGWEWDIWDGNNSPFIRSLHLENAKVVDNCRFDDGILEGKVVDANNNPIPMACVKLYKGDTLMNTVYTMSNGSFKTRELTGGKYDINILATGYKKYTSQETINSNQTTYAQPYVMVKRNGENTGFVEGNIKNAVNGEMVPNVTIKVYKGWNNVSTDFVTQSSSSNGSYSLELMPGNYTVVFSCNNYTDNFINVAVSTDDTSSGNVVINPAGSNGLAKGEFRAVLTWGTTPEDIDSHMFGPTVRGTSKFHVFYSDQEYNSYESTDIDLNEEEDYYDEDGENIVNLDIDDTDGEGPETVTVKKTNRNGIYSYYVHDFTNRSSQNSYALSESGAIVKVYSQNTLVATFNVPLNKEGTVWHVFDYDSSTDKVTPVNTFHYQCNPEKVDSNVYEDNYDDDYSYDEDSNEYDYDYNYD